MKLIEKIEKKDKVVVNVLASLDYDFLQKEDKYKLDLLLTLALRSLEGGEKEAIEFESYYDQVIDEVILLEKKESHF